MEQEDKYIYESRVIFSGLTPPTKQSEVMETIIQEAKNKLLMSAGVIVDIKVDVTQVLTKEDIKLTAKQVIKDVLQAVAKVSCVQSDKILLNSRKGNLPRLRFVCYRLIKDIEMLLGITIGLKLIATEFNKDNHTTVLHGLNEFENLIFIKDKLTTKVYNESKSIILKKYSYAN